MRMTTVAIHPATTVAPARTVTYPLQQWYAAAFSEDVTQQPLARTLLDQRLVLWRTESGVPVALVDRCPHRRAPLSQGAVVGERIECPFHGLQFGADGQCALIPCQESIPKEAHIRGYPAVDRHGHIWVWFGDRQAADADAIPDLHWMTDPDLKAVKGVMLIRANYLTVLDNLLDDTHLPFVHRNSIGTPKMVSAPIDVKYGNDWVAFSRWTLDTPPSPVHARAGGFTTHVDRWFNVRYVKPTTVLIDVGSAPVGTGAPEGDRSKGIGLFSNGTLTPGAGNTTWYFWHNARNFAIDDEEISRNLHADMVRTFEEDSVIVEAVQAVVESDPDPTQINIAGDVVSMRARRIVAQLIAAESAAREEAA
jgi:phenylpropionate dioxygenase-like ring-hydroxylating dioxygenase large terminal subunit